MNLGEFGDASKIHHKYSEKFGKFGGTFKIYHAFSTRPCLHIGNCLNILGSTLSIWQGKEK